MNIDALFCDGTGNYVIPPEPKKNEKIRLRFRTAKDDVDQVFLLVGEQSYEMEKKETRGTFDYYEMEWQLGEKEFHYGFQVSKGGEVKYFNRCGVSGNREEFYSFMITPGFSTPDWAKGAVMYQIFVDRFYNGDRTNDVETGEYAYIGEHSVRVEDWSKYPAFMGVREFYGGDLKGVLEKIDYLQELGVEAVYFNPLFVSPSNHKYDIQDYDYIDPHYGKIVVDEGNTLPDWENNNMNASKYISRVTDKRNLEASNEFFIHFVEEVHKKGMRVILDGVFNHCGSFNKWMDAERIYENQYGYEKGAFVDANSPYRHFFKFYNQNAWPYNDDYDGWWGHKTLPKLNYEESRQLYDYILNVGRKWVSPPYNADGWRLDVAADLGQSEDFNHQFWRDFRTAVKEANPEAIILAEHYEDAGSWLMGDQWDTIMNYSAFMEPVTWFLTGMEKHSDERRGDLLGNAQAFVDAMVYHMSRFQYPSLMVSMNELSNHDHSRFLTRTNQTVGRTASMGAEAANQNVNKGIMRAAVMIQMTWPGAPTLYYGDEAGVCGWTDPDSRRTYPWGKEDLELIEFHRYMTGIHRKIPAIRKGAVKPLLAGYQKIAYGRMYGKYQAVVVISNSPDSQTMDIPVWQLGVTDDMVLGRPILTAETGYNAGVMLYRIKNGMLKLNMPPYSAAVFVSQPDEFYPVVDSRFADDGAAVEK